MDAWSKLGKVIEFHKNPRSYMVKNEHGLVVRRNRRHLLQIPTNKKYMNTQYPDILDTNNHDYNTNDHIPLIEDDPNVRIQSNPQQQLTTRSGRVIRKPPYLLDDQYVYH